MSEPQLTIKQEQTVGKASSDVIPVTITQEHTIAFQIGLDGQLKVQVDLPSGLNLIDAEVVYGVLHHYISQWKEGK